MKFECPWDTGHSRESGTQGLLHQFPCSHLSPSFHKHWSRAEQPAGSWRSLCPSPRLCQRWAEPGGRPEHGARAVRGAMRGARSQMDAACLPLSSRHRNWLHLCVCQLSDSSLSSLLTGCSSTKKRQHRPHRALVKMQ